jgi:CheY-like chemotaxis protein
MPGWKTVPAVALTGYASEKDAAAATRAGFNIHLCKPVEPAELTTLVEDLLKSDDLET